jgi:hypothetical protein
MSSNEESFQHVSYKKAKPVKEKEKEEKEEEDDLEFLYDDWDNSSFHCGCPYDPYPDDPYFGYGPPDNEPESEKLRKEPNKCSKKKCGKSKRKARKSEGEKKLDAIKNDLAQNIKEEQTQE